MIFFQIFGCNTAQTAVTSTISAAKKLTLFFHKPMDLR
jgi:hypothetical protein